MPLMPSTTRSTNTVRNTSGRRAMACSSSCRSCSPRGASRPAAAAPSGTRCAAQRAGLLVGEARQPGGEFAGRLVAAEVPEGGEVGLLGTRLGALLVADHAVCDAEQTPAVAAYQSLDGLLIAAARALDEQQVGQMFGP